MSFRLEHKLFIKKEHITNFKKYLFNNGASSIYEKRNIHSLYFENKKNEMYTDSIEGSVPRKKIRIRYYPNSSSNKIFFEKKISGIEGRFKKRNEINKFEFESLKSRGINDTQYGKCYPIVFVTYEREYYKIDDVRVTIDNNISYQQYRKKIAFKDPHLIVELKSSMTKDLDELLKLFPFQNIRFSKYCNGYKIIFNA